MTLMAAADRAEAETAIRGHLRRFLGSTGAAGTLGALAPGEVLLGFLPLPGEPDLVPLLRWLLETGRQVVLPSVVPDRPRQLKLLQVSTPEALESTRPGPLGTTEPQNAREIGPDAIHIMLVPGVAFMRSGERLGRGGGYFDSLIADKSRRALAVGVAFEAQVVASMPVEPHDATVDRLCTERGLTTTP